MRMKLLLTFIAIFAMNAFAQTRSVSGTVYSASDHEPLIGATVKVKDTMLATATDIDGKFNGYNSETEEYDKELFTGDDEEDPWLYVEFWFNEPKADEGDDSGVANVGAIEDAPVMFYNLNGQRVENPSNGIFIRKQGSKTSKVVIR